MSELRSPIARNIAAEEAVIGACLAGGESLASIRAAGLEPVHLSQPPLAAILMAAYALDDAGEAVDAVLVGEHLRAAGTLNDAGGQAALAALVTDVPALPHAVEYAGIVRNLAAERAALAAALEVVEVLKGDGDTASKLARLARLAEEVEPPKPPGDASLYGAAGELLDVLERGEARVPTGVADLDRLLCGGLAPGSLTVVGARPSMGKSALVQQIAEHVAKSAGVLFVSAEMSRADVALRAIVARTGLPTSRLLPRPDEADMGRFVEAVGTLAHLRLDVHDGPADLARIAALARAMARSPEGLSLVAVDYLQLLDGGTGERRERDVAALSTGLKRLAQRLGVPVLLASQLNRALEQRSDKRPILADLRDSGQVEQDADVVIFIYRDEVYNPDSLDVGTAELLVAKNRHGAPGLVRQHWRAERMCFAPLAREDRR